MTGYGREQSDWGPPRGLDALDKEYEALEGAYLDYGFDEPPEMPRMSFLQAVSKPFAPNETPYAHNVKGMPQQYADYLAGEVHPELHRAAEDGEPAALALAWQAGRVRGANGIQGPLVHFSKLDIEIDEAGFTTDEKRVAHDFETGEVLEYGMGLRGIFYHLRNVREGLYGVYAIHKLRGETALLQGILDFNDITPQQMQLGYGGIQERVDELLQQGYEDRADLIIASRVHMAGDDLRHGVREAGRLLRLDGILLARGPRRIVEADWVCGYDEVKDMVEADPRLDMIMTTTVAAISSSDELEPTRLVVAEKLQ